MNDFLTQYCQSNQTEAEDNQFISQNDNFPTFNFASVSNVCIKLSSIYLY
jgi:hypothetical protein